MTSGVQRVSSPSGFGQSSLNAPLNTVALDAIPEGRARMGSGKIGMTRGLGEAFSVAVLSFLLEYYAFFNLYSIPPLQGAAFAASERLHVLSEIHGLLIDAGQFGLALQEGARSLLAHTLINQALTQHYLRCEWRLPYPPPKDLRKVLGGGCKNSF